MADLLEDTRARDIKRRLWMDGHWWVPVGCASCGKDQGVIHEDMSFGWVLCDDCAEKYGAQAVGMWMPNQVIAAEAKHVQLEQFGRYLTQDEMNEELKDGSSTLAKLAREIT